jgi:cytochrome b pre-mRNA-processing protein 3
MTFFFRRRSERLAAEELYAAVVAAARRPELYIDHGVADTPEGRFEMIALHLFALTHRLMHEPGGDPELARRVTESFVTDMDASLRELGVGDLSVPKRMKKLFASFAGRLTAYEKALAEGGDALAAAIARNVFPDGEVKGRALPLAKHLLATIQAMGQADLAELRLGKATFPPVREVNQG